MKDTAEVKKNEMIDREIIDLLTRIPLFEDIKNDPESIALVASHTSLVKYSGGDTIIEEGSVGDKMFVVYRGSVEIRKRTRAGDNYTVAILDWNNNVFFGELALVDDDTRSATVIAREDSTFLVLTKKDFLDLGKSYPHIALPITRAIARILAGRLRKTTSDMITIFDALVEELQQ